MTILLMVLVSYSCGNEKENKTKSKQNYEEYVIYDKPDKFGDKIDEDDYTKIEDDGSWVAIIDNEKYTTSQFVGDLKIFFEIYHSKAEEQLYKDDYEYIDDVLNEIIFNRLLYKQMSASKKYLASKNGDTIREIFSNLVKIDVLFLLDCWNPLRKKIDKLKELENMAGKCKMAIENRINNDYKVEFNDKLVKLYKSNMLDSKEYFFEKFDKKYWFAKVEGKLSIPFRKLVVPDLTMDEIKAEFQSLGLEFIKPSDFDTTHDDHIKKIVTQEIAFYEVNNNKKVNSKDAKKYYNMLLVNKMANFYLKKEYLSRLIEPTAEDVAKYIKENRMNLKKRLEATGMYKEKEEISELEYETMAQSSILIHRNKESKKEIKENLFSIYKVRISKNTKEIALN